MNNRIVTEASEAAQALAFVSDEVLGGRTENRDELGVYLATHTNTDFPLSLFTATIADAQDAALGASLEGEEEWAEAVSEYGDADSLWDAAIRGTEEFLTALMDMVAPGFLQPHECDNCIA